MEGIMKLKNMSKEELELMSYTDLTEMLIKENKKPMNTPTVFHKICDLLGYSEDEYASKIGDYYTSLTIDKRFVLLDNNEWDLRDHHSIDLSLEEDDEEDEEMMEEEVEEPEEEEENIDEVNTDEELEVDDDDDIDELNIISDEDDEME
jgi:DNA-directed RNA polymerase subunit delta